MGLIGARNGWTPRDPYRRHEGAGSLVCPGVSIGRNGRIAFGPTIFSIDQEDLYVYRTNPDNPQEYRYRDRWEPMQVQRDTIAVRDGSAVEVELWFTRHGPVIYTDRDNHTAFAVRAAWLQPGPSTAAGLVRHRQA